MQTPGTYISAVGHTALIGWLILGWGFNSEPLDFEVMTVTAMSGEEFEQMTAAQTPEPGEAEPTELVQPEIDETAPAQPAQEQAALPAPPPEPVEQPEEETPPPPPPQPLVTDATDEPPIEPQPPAPPAAAPDLPPSDDPTPEAVPRVAPEAVTPPDNADVADVQQDAVVPDEAETAEEVEEPQEATSPEEAATELAIEDEEPSGAVETSMRPTARPSRPAPPAPEPEEETQTADAEAETPPAAETDTSVEDLLAGVVGDEPAAPQAPAVAAGPPMTGSERDSFRVAVNRCWNVDPGSVAARVTVEVGFNLNPDGTVQGEPRMISSDGDQSATQTAFEAARRAILRCQSGGYQLPADKYDQWKEVVITFDPSGMRLR